MNLTNNYQPVHTKDYLSQYLYSNTKNQNNNPLSIYLSSNINESKQKTDLSHNNYNKKPLNLDIGEDINNSLNDHKIENTISIRRYSSFSHHNINNMKINTFKKTLILDLDETLVHSAFTPFSRKSDFILNINIEGENKTLYVLKRPHVDKFLYELSLLYEIIIFTASISAYANPLLDQLDKNNYIKYRLFREHCTFNNGIYIKDLKIFDRKINNMIIIDNNPLSYDNNIENGIPILSWYDNINDNELLKLLPLLKYMSDNNVQDVRIIINKIVNRNTNEIDYLAINKILNTNSNNNYGALNNQNSIRENNNRKNNKSQEKKKNISKNKDFTKNENIAYNNRTDFIKPLKNNYIKNNDNENRNYLDNKLFNTRYNQNNYLYNENLSEKENEEINIDKMDPSGIRKSIFAPEEYNIPSAKSLHYSYNTNTINNNYDYNKKRFEEKKNEDKLYNTMKEEKEYLNDCKNAYDCNTISYKNEKIKRSLTPNINGKRKNDFEQNNENNLEGTISKKYSLVELTIKALHIMDDANPNKKRNNKKDKEYDTINSTNTSRDVYKYNNYFRKENEIIYNDYINNNKYIGNYKSNNVLNKNTLNRKYYNNFIEESKNINENTTNDKLNSNNKMNASKKIDTYNERFMNTEKKYYNNRMNNENKNKLLERINNEKINNFLNNNKDNNNNNKLYDTGNNFYNIYRNNYSQDNFYNSLKKSYAENKNNLKSNSYKNKKDIFTNNEQNNLNNEKNNGFNNRYDLFIQNENKESEKPNNNLNNNSSNNLNVSSLKGRKKPNKIDEHHLMRSSSYIDSNTEIEKLLDRFSTRNNYDKENYSNNVNYNIQYGNNLNYKYDLLNIQNKPKFTVDNNKYYNTFSRTNYIK